MPAAATSMPAGPGLLLPVLTSAEGAALLINDKECDPNHQDDKSDRPENNAHLEGMVQEQQDDIKATTVFPSLKPSIPASKQLHAGPAR